MLYQYRINRVRRGGRQIQTGKARFPKRGFVQDEVGYSR